MKIRFNVRDAWLYLGLAGIEIWLYISQEELAQMVGATREVVSLCLNHFRDSGFTRYHRKGRITINSKALEGNLQRQ